MRCLTSTVNSLRCWPRWDGIGRRASSTRISLSHALRQDPAGTDPAVAVARYCLAEQLLKMKAPGQALEVVLPGVSLAGGHEWLLRVAEARALWDVGRRRESRQSAERAIERSPSEAKAKELRSYLAGILDGDA